jgi:hypothetical protein
MTVAEQQSASDNRPLRPKYVVVRYTSSSDTNNIRYRPSPLDEALTLDAVRERLAKDEIMYYGDVFRDADQVVVPQAVEKSCTLLDVAHVRSYPLTIGTAVRLQANIRLNRRAKLLYVRTLLNLSLIFCLLPGWYVNSTIHPFHSGLYSGWHLARTDWRRHVEQY